MMADDLGGYFAKNSLSQASDPPPFDPVQQRFRPSTAEIKGTITMSVAPFTRHLTLSLAFVAVAWASPRQADAAIITQTQTQNFSLGSTSISLSWAQFDSNLGQLLGIEYEVEGTLGGFFTVSNGSALETVDVFDSNIRLRTIFQGVGAPGTVFGSLISPIITDPTTGPFPGTTIAPASTVQFDVETNPTQLMVSNTVDFYPAFESYFTGNGTVSQSLGQVFQVTLEGDTIGLTSSLLTSGEATLRYIYDDNPTVIPEPFTAAFTGLLIGGGAIVGARRKRRLAKADKKS